MTLLFRICLIAFTAFASGCATKYGVQLPGTGPSQEQARQFEERFRDAAKEVTKSQITSEVKTILFSADFREANRVKMVVVGSVLAFTEAKKELANKVFDDFEKKANESKEPLKFTRDWYVNNLAGFTQVKYWHAPLLGARMAPAQISKEIKESISFPSAMSSTMFLSGGDLVVVENFDGAGSWITRVLCAEKSPDYDVCAKKYPKGLFQGLDGREINASLKVIEGGKRINLATYEAVEAK